MVIVKIIVFIYLVYALGQVVNRYFPILFETIQIPWPEFVYTYQRDLPPRGILGMIYVLLDTGELRLWDGKAYLQIVSSPESSHESRIL